MQTYFWSRFARLSDEGKVDLFTQALNINSNQAKNMLDLVYQNLQKQDSISKAIHVKTEITKEAQQMIDKIKIQNIKPLKPRKFVKLENQLKFYYFEIDKLRKENYSFKKISDFLKTNYNIKINSKYLSLIYKKQTNQINDGKF